MEEGTGGDPPVPIGRGNGRSWRTRLWLWRHDLWVRFVEWRAEHL